MKFFKEVLLASSILLSTTVQANVTLNDNDQILGQWNVYAEAIGLHKEKTALSVLWEFREDGVLHTESEDRRGRTKKMVIDLKYAVEDGVIKKQLSVGRSKMESCKVVELAGNDMVLKCKFLHFFLRR